MHAELLDTPLLAKTLSDGGSERPWSQRLLPGLFWENSRSVGFSVGKSPGCGIRSIHIVTRPFTQAATTRARSRHLRQRTASVVRIDIESGASEREDEKVPREAGVEDLDPFECEESRTLAVFESPAKYTENKTLPALRYKNHDATK